LGDVVDDHDRALGYATASAFIALFRRVFGEPPAAYRAKLVDRTGLP